MLHRGFPIDQLATDSNYLEVCYILLNGEKPTQEQYDEFKTTVTRHTMIHQQITRLFHAFRRDSHPMAVMCGITGALAAFYHDSLDVNNPRHREIAAFRLLFENADHGSDVLQVFHWSAICLPAQRSLLRR
ncbi:citrate/2-methylcitrate synthase [Escherichia coli]